MDEHLERVAFERAHLELVVVDEHLDDVLERRPPRSLARVTQVKLEGRRVGGRRDAFFEEATRRVRDIQAQSASAQTRAGRGVGERLVTRAAGE